MGFIIDQSQVRGIRYGLFSSTYNGCGWIAAYNVLYRLGRKKSPEKVATEMSRGLVLGGMFGTTLRGFKTYVGRYANITEYKASFDRHIKNEKCGVLHYSLPNGAKHFVYVEYLGDDLQICRYLNPTCRAQTIASYLTEQKARCVTLLTMGGQDDKD